MKKYALLALMLVLISSGLGYAQEDLNTPIFFNMQGDLWSYTPSTGELTQKSSWGYNETPILSPDGTRFAYLSLAQVGAVAMAQNGMIFDPRPMNIWIWDLVVDDAYRLAEQPANARFNGDYIENAIRRSSLAWSPDGTQLAWIELRSDYGFELVTFNFETQTTRLLTTDLTYPYADAGFSGEHVMKWGEGGLAVQSGGFDSEYSSFVDTLSIYDPASGALLRRDIVSGGDNFLLDFSWVSASEIILIYQELPWMRYSALDGSLVETDYVRLQGAGSVIESINLGKVLADGQQAWVVFWTGGQPIPIITKSIRDQVAFSPNGDLFAFVDDALFVWTGGGDPQKIAGTEGLLDTYPRGLIWGLSTWSAPFSGIPCLLPSRLQVNGQGAVLAHLGANVLRDRAGKAVDGSLEIGTIPPNGVFRVLGGPECVSGHLWWLVDYEGQVGWTAEGEGASTYWLEPR